MVEHVQVRRRMVCSISARATLLAVGASASAVVVDVFVCAVVVGAGSIKDTFQWFLLTLVVGSVLAAPVAILAAGIIGGLVCRATNREVRIAGNGEPPEDSAALVRTAFVRSASDGARVGARAVWALSLTVAVGFAARAGSVDGGVVLFVLATVVPIELVAAWLVVRWVRRAAGRLVGSPLPDLTNA